MNEFDYHPTFDPFDGRIWLETGQCYLVPNGQNYWAVGGGLAIERGPEILLQSKLLDFGKQTAEGTSISSVFPSWLEIARRLKIDPAFRFEFSSDSRKFEEFLAGTYATDGWRTLLTPRSGDHGIDVIASREDEYPIRIIEQAKAYRPGRLVKHDDVRAICGALMLQGRSASKGMITTTSGFQPRISTDPEYKDLLPFRLGLRDGKEFLKWVGRVSKGAK